MRVLIGFETSGVSRRRWLKAGFDVISVDLLPAVDGGQGRHIVGDVFTVVRVLIACGWVPDFAIFHPTCTYLTNSAEWAYADPDYARYPGVGYHQRVKPGTLTGAARRIARDEAVSDVERLRRMPFVKVIENPRGALSSRICKPVQTVQPYQFGDDASKATCLWVFGPDGGVKSDWLLKVHSWLRRPGRLVEWPRGSGKLVERWGNQTDSGQNCLSPGADRWAERSVTYPGIGDAMVRDYAPKLKKTPLHWLE